MFSLIIRILVCFSFIFLSSCQLMPEQDNYDVEPKAISDTGIYKSIPSSKLTTAPRKISAEGLKLLEAGKYREASDLFNLAVKTDITNSYFQYLNALAYHLRGLNGESGLLPLAETGYELAIKFDKTNWLAHYYMGLLYLDQRNYRIAKIKFGHAALYKEDEPELLYNLAVAAYYDQDVKTAAAALAGLRDLNNPDYERKALRASAIVSSAMNEPDEASRYLEQYKRVAENKRSIDYVEERVVDWQELNRKIMQEIDTNHPDSYQKQFQKVGAVSRDEFDLNTSAPDVGNYETGDLVEEDFVDREMAIVDVVIIRTEEDINTSFGVNLLQGLQFQFGNPLDGTPGFSYSTTNNDDKANTFNNINSDTITSFISVPSVTYSLNIANSNNARNEVLARPSLIALSGETSEFFSGVDITGAAVSGGDGDSVSVEKEVGVKLAVTPEFLPNDLVKLSIQAQRTFLTNPSASVVFDFRLDTTKTIVDANVVMRFGETLILSGLSEKELERNRDGVPFLQDVPGLQYFFSRKTTRDFLKSVLILITPRRAQYVNQTAEARRIDRAKFSEDDKAMAEFEDKYIDWFVPLPTTAPIFRHFQDNSVYNEFRTGDLTMQNWNTYQSHEERLKAAMEFIYY